MKLQTRLAKIENNLDDCLKIVNKLDGKSFSWSSDLLLLISNEIDVIDLRLKQLNDLAYKKEKQHENNEI